MWMMVFDKGPTNFKDILRFGHIARALTISNVRLTNEAFNLCGWWCDGFLKKDLRKYFEMYKYF